MKSTPKVALGSGSRNINDSQDKPTTSSTNEEENSFKDTVRNILYEKKQWKKITSLMSEILLKRNLKLTRAISKK